MSVPEQGDTRPSAAEVAAEHKTVVGMWTKKADNDLRAARQILALTEDCPLEAVGFHAQQCAEKYLKALLVTYGHDVPRTHDLGALVDQLAHLNILPQTLASLPLGTLTQYAVETRYADDLILDRAVVSEAINIAARVQTSIRAVVQDVLDNHQPRLL